MMKHECGCITRKEKEVIVIFPCNLHRANKKWIYIALKHRDIKPRGKTTRWSIDYEKLGVKK